MLSSLYHISSPSLYSFVSIELYTRHGVAGVNLFFANGPALLLWVS